MGSIKFVCDAVLLAVAAEVTRVLEGQKQQRKEKRATPEVEAENTRILTALDAVRVKAPIVAQRAVVAIEKDNEYRASLKVVGDHPLMAATDKKMDQTVLSLEVAFQAALQIMAEDDPLLAAAKALYAEVFPVAGEVIADESYVNELALVENMVKIMVGHEALLTNLGLIRFLRRMEALLPDYRYYLNAPAPKIPYSTVTAAEELAYQGLLGLMARIVAVYPDEDEVHTEGRGRLFKALQQQNQEMAAERRLGPRKKERAPNPEPVAPAVVAPANGAGNVPAPIAPVAPVVEPQG